MIPEIWDKKIPCVITLHSQDDTSGGHIPMCFLMSWNHYIGFYHESIIDFFLSSAPFPFNSEEFFLKDRQTQQQVHVTQIVSHYYLLKNRNKECLNFVCHFRRSQTLPAINIKQHYKNNLKSSTASRYGFKGGASKLTLDMTVNNFQNMYKGFEDNHLEGFLGNLDPEEGNYAFKFLVEQSPNIPIKIISKEWTVERNCPTHTKLNQFIDGIFSGAGLEDHKRDIRIHGVSIDSLADAQLKQLLMLCHPDGFLYFTV